MPKFPQLKIFSRLRNPDQKYASKHASRLLDIKVHGQSSVSVLNVLSLRSVAVGPCSKICPSLLACSALHIHLWLNQSKHFSMFAEGCKKKDFIALFWTGSNLTHLQCLSTDDAALWYTMLSDTVDTSFQPLAGDVFSWVIAKLQEMLMHCVHGVPKMWTTNWWRWLCQNLTDFQNSFTVRKRSKL